jgi:4-hydroxybenzoyl-CoA reductase subunit beta
VRLPSFEYLKPETLDQALSLLASHQQDAKILAGGTDLLVRMKKGLLKPKVLITLRALEKLSFIEKQADHIVVGSGTSLADIIASDLIHREANALFQACERIGAVTLQHHRGTIGGNILQDNRCHHYNQSAFHRSGRQACHKDGGKICYAREEADRCNSTCQSDGASALMALDARIILASKDGERVVHLTDFYTDEGIRPHAIEPYELLKEIIIPIKDCRSAYQRLSYRSAIDYPIVCAGVRLIPATENADEIGEARIVVGAMGRSPLFIAPASSSLKGKRFTDVGAFKKAADAAMDSAATFAVHNVGATLAYRNSMVSHLVFKALCEAAQISGNNACEERRG